jgi:hypothetical protein
VVLIQPGLRAYNERLLISVLQRNGAMAGVELARRTGLSLQTTSVILRKLERDGFLRRCDPLKGSGKVGIPSVPFDFDPDCVFSWGLKVGRRSADLLVLDLKGASENNCGRHTIIRCLIIFLVFWWMDTRP